MNKDGLIARVSLLEQELVKLGSGVDILTGHLNEAKYQLSLLEAPVVEVPVVSDVPPEESHAEVNE